VLDRRYRLDGPVATGGMTSIAGRTRSKQRSRTTRRRRAMPVAPTRDQRPACRRPPRRSPLTRTSWSTTVSTV